MTNSSTYNNNTLPENPSGVENKYKSWFLYYASYVILERAIPAIEDGLKPVHRRILHAMNEMDDGRFNKVANIIGQSMQYHPHGDASIGDALVHIGQREYLIEPQGNWGDVRTGDDAAAPRYIEARLSKLAKKIAFNDKLTDWQLSYDGRKREPITLPMKFPLLLLHGADGIAVGLSTKILPHNFLEICTACIQYLKGKKVELYPDFQTEGLIDVSQYKWGERGGKVKIRCRIEERDKQTLVIKDTPFSVTTPQLIESITKANEIGKLKIKKITDNTAENVEIVLELAAGITTVQTIDALYKFTKAQVSISTNACVIDNQKPEFLNVIDILQRSAERTKQLLAKELTILIAEQEDVWHYTSLEKIFFEQQIYKRLEQKQKSWEDVLIDIKEGFLPYEKKLKRPVGEEDVKKLVEKPVRRIHKVDIDELDAKIRKTENQIKEHKENLAQINEYTIRWYEELRSEFKQGNHRKTSIQPFYEKDVKDVAIKNEKLYVNYKEGFVGTGLKKDEFVCDCSDVDDILVISKQGVMKVVKMAEKVFIDKNILYVGIYQRSEDTSFNMIYFNGKTRIYYAKKFLIGGVTRDKEYQLASDAYGSKVIYLSSDNENETVTVTLSPNTSARIKQFDFNFAELSLGSRSVVGNQVTKYTIHSVKLNRNKSVLTSPKDKTIEVYYDTLFGRINQETQGQLIDTFGKDELLLTVYSNGTYELTEPQEEKIVDPSKIIAVQKWNAKHIFTAIYFDQEKKANYIKRFQIETTTKNKRFEFLTDEANMELLLFTAHENPTLRINVGTKKAPTYLRSKTNDWVKVMNIRALGVPLPVEKKIAELNWLE